MTASAIPPVGSDMARFRDYKAEYERRLARAQAKGLSRSQGRGHARSGETPIRSPPVHDNARLEAALRELRRTGKQGGAARSEGISPERFRRYLLDRSLAKRRGRTWTFTDNRLREMTVISEDGPHQRLLRGFEDSSLNGKHLAAVGRAINANDPDLLSPFLGVSVVDARGKSHALETDLNQLYRLAASGGEVFHDVYRLIL